MSTEDGLVVTEYRELLALHRSLVIARFDGSGPRFDEILLSPLVAEISRRTLRAIIARLHTEARSNDAAGWTRWSLLGEDAPQLAVVRDALSRDGLWTRLGALDKRSRALDALAPFEVPDEVLQRLIEDVDRVHCRKADGSSGA